jgi:hypothetical protein
MVWEPKRLEPRVACRPRLRDQIRQMVRDLLARLELRVQEQADFHGSVSFGSVPTLNQ